MLNFIRRSTQGGLGKAVMAIAMGLLIISFGIWGIGDIFRGHSDSSVARVGGEKITAYEVQQAFQRELAVIRRQAGQELDADQARALGFDRRVLGDLINGKLFDLANADLGLGMPDSVVVHEIQDIPAFKSETGKFDRVRFEQALQTLNYTEASFVAALRSDLLRKQLFESMLGGMPVPDAIAGPLMSFSGERRTVRYVVIPEEQAGTVPTATDDEVHKRYNEGKSLYMTPEYRRFTFVDINTTEIAKTIALKDEEIRARFDAQKDKYSAPEKRTLEQLVFQKETDARAAADALKGGKSFADLVKTQGKTLADTNIGEKSKADLPAKTAEAVFAAPADGIAGPVEGPFGWLVIHIAKITPAAERSFDSMKSEIAADLTKERANDEVYKRSTKFEEARNGSAQFEDAAKANGAEVVSIAAADVDGKDPTGAPVKALEGRSAILADAFKGSPGTEPDLQETPGGGGYHLVRVDSVTPPAERPFDQVKAEIRKSLDEEKHRAALLKLAQDLAAKGKAGTSLDTFASGFGKAALKSPPLTRSAENDTFSTRAIQAVFAARQGDFVTAPVKSGTGVLLMQVDGVERPSAQEVAATFAQTKPQLGEMLSNELVTIYADSLRERYRVTVDEKALHSATGGS